MDEEEMIKAMASKIEQSYLSLIKSGQADMLNGGTGRMVAVVDGKIVKKWQHTPPTRHIVAFCPHCLTYGSPMGKEDRECGNCGKTDLRIYEEIEKAGE